MNTFTRGVRNAFRNSVRTGSIVLILALSTGLIIAMLAARQAVEAKINEVKSSSGTTISIAPAGVRGFDGGGTALTADQISKVAGVANVVAVESSLNDRLSSDQTSLQSAIEPGAFGRRFAGADANGSPTRTFTLPVMVTGVSDASAIGQGSGTITWKSGQAFDASKDQNIAVLGSAIATKNNLSVGSSFTAYGQTVMVAGIYETSNTFGNNGVYFPLVALQRLSSQPGSVTAASATVNSSDNLATATSAIKTQLGASADVTNSQDVADATAKPLENVRTIATYGVVGAMVAGAAIILLTMVMIVRERRREVGVMKAIGASSGKIMSQFVFEALTLTVLGLVVGTGIGIVAATPLTRSLVQSSTVSAAPTPNGRPVRSGGFRTFGRASQQAVQNITTSVGTATLAEGVLAALLIAVVGSAGPALIVSKIKPADAMRSE